MKRLLSLFALGLLVAAFGVWKARRAMQPLLNEIDSYVQGESLMEGK